MTKGFHALIEGVARRAAESGVFGPVGVKDGMLVCEAKSSAAPAEYRLSVDEGKVWVSLVTADRWLSQSIEADLMHTGDKLEDLLGEELADQGYSGDALPFQHYRSEEKLFTFRSPLPLDAEPDAGDTAAVELATRCLLAYEACFRRLGDVEAGEEG